MSDTLITITVILLAGILIFVFPVITIAERVDAVSQENVEILTTEFVNEIMTTGKLTQEKYYKFLESLNANRKYI